MSIVSQLIQIILRKRAPQDIDFNVAALVLVITGTFTLQAVTLGMVPAYTQPTAYAAVYTIANVIGIYLILAMHKKDSRFVQTSTALFGVSLILQMMSIFAAVSGPLAFTSIMITFWQIFILILILRAALECSMIKAIGLTVLYQFFIGFSLFLVFPEFQTEFSSIWQEAAKQAQQS